MKGPADGKVAGPGSEGLFLGPLLTVEIARFFGGIPFFLTPAPGIGPQALLRMIRWAT